MAVTILLLLFLLQLTFQEDTVNYPSVRSAVRRQKPFAEEHPFPCDPSGPGARSPVRPTSVHRLRPGDIDVIGALGDSLIAGNGALEEYALAAFIEHRGVSWCAGGQGTWREFLTLPNILKVFNQNLMGYSTGQGEFLAPNSNFNVAFPVSIDDDAERQARLLVHKMRRNPKIDFQNDWKMVTIMFGANDLCSAQCFNHEGHTANSHAQKLQAALDFLRDNSPRTFVNLIPVLDVSVSLRVKQTWMCRFLHTLFCQCFHRRKGGENVVDTILKLVRDYQSAEQRLVRSGRYDGKEDFTVVLQPFTMYFNARPGHLHEEVIDVSYITHDCFHFSQKGHALAANLLWNNLLEPVGNKSLEMMAHIMDKLRCPTPEAPFLFTAENSRTFLRTGRQWETEDYKGSSAFELQDENRLENN